MNMTITVLAVFLFFALCGWAVAWRGVKDWFLAMIILVGVFMFFGSVDKKIIRSATCPKCEHVFEAPFDIDLKEQVMK